MKLARNFRLHPAWVCVVPLIHVLFLVVIFFAMSSRFALQPGLAVNLPSSSFTLNPQQNSQLVSLLSAPTPTIYHRDQKVTLAELGQRLSAANLNERSLIIRADRGTSYEFIMQVINQSLQQGFSVVLATNREPR